jgi:hypothetical protein
MSEHNTHTTFVPVDELWLRDWAQEGLARLEQYLARQAEFSAFLRARSVLDSGHGDSAAAS